MKYGNTEIVKWWNSEILKYEMLKYGNIEILEYGNMENEILRNDIWKMKNEKRAVIGARLGVPGSHMQAPKVIPYETETILVQAASEWQS